MNGPTGEGITTLAKNLDVTGTFGRSCVGRARVGETGGEGKEVGKGSRTENGSCAKSWGSLDFEKEKKLIEMNYMDGGLPTATVW